MAEITGVRAAAELEFGLLGPLRVTRCRTPQSLGGRQQKAVLAILLIEANNVVSVDRLADAIWGERVPKGSVTTIRTYIGHLRDIVEAGRSDAASCRVLLTEPGGYRLRVDEATIDAVRFERRVHLGRSFLDAGQFADASTELSAALAMWRGPVLADLADYDFVRPAATRLDELRLAATEARIDADLALGRHRELAGELDRLVTAHPLRERLHGQRMLALYRCEQQADALDGYRRLRGLLSEELGIDPGRPLQALYEAILRQDRHLDWRPNGTPASEPGVTAGAADRSGPTSRRRVRGRRRAFAAVAAGLGLAGGCVIALSPSHPQRLSALPANSVGRIDALGRLRAAVAVDQSPSAVAYGGGALWSANSGDDTVSRINPTSGRVEQTIVVGESPTAITVTGDDVWVANGGAGTVSRINALSKTVVATVKVGNLPSAIGSGPSGVWVVNRGDDTVQRIDSTSGEPGDPVPVGGEPAGISVGSDTVWVTNSQDGTVSRLSAQTGQTASPIPVGAGPRGIAATSDAIWVANGLELTLSRIDPASARVVATIPVGDGPHSVVAAFGSVWVTGEFDGTLTKIDPATDKAVRRIATGASLRGLAAVGGSVWVASASLASSAHHGGALTITGSGVPPIDGIDPAASYETGTSDLLYDGLVALRRVGGAAGTTLVPDLATALPRPTDGGRTYTFTVRRGILYSSGAEVKPDDLRRGLQRTLALSHWDPGYYFRIIGAQACAHKPDSCDLSRGVQTDDANSTIVFHLTEPDPDFLHKLALFVLATARSVPMQRSSTPLPATGPYMISDYKPGGHSFTLVRNPYFHRWSFAAKPNGYPDVIRWTTRDGFAARVADVVAGRADLTFLGAGPAEIADLALRYPTRLHSDFGMGTYLEWLNTRVPPFNDVRVRRALNYAVDRQKLVALRGGPTHAALSCQVLPPNFPGYRPYCPFTPGPDRAGSYHGPDVATARKLIAASGTRGMTVRIWSQPWPASRTVSNYYAGLLRSLGYRVPPVVVTQGMFTDAVDSRNHVQIGDAWWGADFPVPSNFWQPQLSCGAFIPASHQSVNLSEYCSPRVDELGRRALAMQTVDPAAARRLWTQVDHALTDDAPWIFGPASLNTALVSPRVGNYMANPALGPLLDQMWVK